MSCSTSDGNLLPFSLAYVPLRNRGNLNIKAGPEFFQSSCWLLLELLQDRVDECAGNMPLKPALFCFRLGFEIFPLSCQITLDSRNQGMPVITSSFFFFFLFFLVVCHAIIGVETVVMSCLLICPAGGAGELTTCMEGGTIPRALPDLPFPSTAHTLSARWALSLCD